MNYIVIMGRLTADPEVKQTSDGVNYSRFTVAVDRDYVRDSERDVDFIPVVAWRTTAEFVARNFAKGQMIAIHGSLRISRYEKNDTMTYSAAIKADRVFFAGSQKERRSAAADAAANSTEDIRQDIQQYDLSEYEEILSNMDVPF